MWDKEKFLGKMRDENKTMRLTGYDPFRKRYRTPLNARFQVSHVTLKYKKKQLEFVIALERITSGTTRFGLNQARSG